MYDCEFADVLAYLSLLCDYNAMCRRLAARSCSHSLGSHDDLCRLSSTRKVHLVAEIFKLVIMILIVAHLLACLWYGIGGIDVRNGTTWREDSTYF